MSWFDSTHWTISFKTWLPVRLAASGGAALSRQRVLSVAIAASAVFHLSPLATTAQEVGDRVRVYVGRETLVGRVSEMQEDAFRIDLGSGESRSVARAEILWLERDVGMGSNAVPWGKKGFLRGGLGGASMGFLLGLAVGPICRGSECDHSVLEHIQAGALYGVLSGGIGGFLGGATGLILGASTPQVDWQVIPEQGTATGFHPVVGLWKSPEGRIGLAFGGRIRF